MLVGLLNTLLVSVLAGVLATLHWFRRGLRAAVAQSGAGRGWRRLYVETVRNLPLLLQILFWYVAMLSPLPGPADSLSFRAAFS